LNQALSTVERNIGILIKRCKINFAMKLQSGKHC